MSADEDRLSRWSRLKSEAAAPAAPESAPPPPDLADDAFIAALPRIEEIDAATDIRGFLRAGVPLALRNAALARMWSADPAIRDRIPDAVDYAEDYNAPHTISGWGSACPQEARTYVERALEPQPTRDADPQPEPERLMTESQEPPEARAPPAAPQVVAGAAAEAPPPPQKVARPRPRHGGALPEIG